MIRLMLLALAAMFGAALPASAGTVSSLEILGFSADGKVFAFEEYGVQDGSGFPFSNRFYIDTATDEFVPGTPIRVRLDDEAQSLGTAREQARTQGESVVPAAELAAHRGFTAGHNAVTEYSADPHRMVVNPRPIFPPADAAVEFRIDELSLETPQDCENLGEVKGYRLLRLDPAPGGQTKLVDEDATIPQSRGCPLGYRIGAVQTFHPDGGEPVFAVLIAVRSFGFEGPDFRWLAVAGRF